MTEPVLQLDRITKRFGDLVANDAISLQLHAGEVLALLGENGAGKTNLMEAVSLLSPGRGLRRAAPEDLIGRQAVVGFDIHPGIAL